MAVVPISAPSVSGRAVSNAFDSGAGNTAEAFGAGRAKDLTGLGASIQGLGKDMSAIANDMAVQLAHTERVRQTVDGDNRYSEARTPILYGGEGVTGYYGLKGTQAMEARAGTIAALTKARDEIAGTIADPKAKAMFLAQATRTLQSDTESINRLALRETAAAADTAGVARMRLASQEAFNVRNDPARVASSLSVMRGEAQQWAQRNGRTPEEAEVLYREKASNALIPVIHDMALTDARAAQKMLATFGSSMTPDDVMRVSDSLRPKIVAQEARAAVEADWFQETSKGGTTFRKDNIRAESGGRQLDPKTGGPLTSSAGAIGIAQVMPGTAKETAAKNGIEWNETKFKLDADYNLRLGELYHQEQMAKYGNKVIADAAYNAGPGNVDKWLADPKIGDPRKGEVSYEQWVSRIPFKETRLYITEKVGSLGGGGPTGFAYPDYAAMERKIIARTEGDPERRGAELAILADKRQRFNVQIKERQTTLVDDMGNLKAAFESGRSDVAIPYSDIRASFPAAQATQFIAELEETKEFSNFVSAIQGATPEELRQMQTALSTGQGDVTLLPSLSRGKVTAPTEGGGEGGDLKTAALRQRHLARFKTAVDRRNAAFEADSVAFVSSLPGMAEAEAKARASGNMAEYTRLLRSEQLRLGRGQFDLRTLSNAQVKEQVDRLNNLDPESADLRKELQGLAQAYGDQWPNVMGDLVKHGKLSWEFQALADMDLPTQAGAASSLQRAIQMQARDPKKFGDSIKDRKLLFDTLPGELAAAQKSFAIGGVDTFNKVVRPAIETLAQYYAMQTVPGQEAARKAVADVITAKYDFAFDDYLRVPKKANGESQVAEVTRAAIGVQSRLTALDLAVPDERPGEFMNPNERRAIALLAAKEGVWTASPDGAGAVLNMRDPVSGAYHAVRGADGKWISFRFDNLPAEASVGELIREEQTNPRQVTPLGVGGLN